MVKHVYRVRYGFDSNAKVRVEAGPELERVIYAWLQQAPVAAGGKMIHGKHIISIEPDHHYYTGWYDTYEPKSGEDLRQIQRDCPPTLETVFDLYVERVRTLVREDKTELIGRSEPININSLIEIKHANNRLASQS